jgi:ABC-type sugar transport system permease subunit
VKNEKVRGPLVSVFLWTITFAGLTVLTQFALGLLVAMAMNKAIRGRRIYRSIFILPYAMPSIMSILIWAGMVNTEFGAINNILNTDIAWFSSPNFARAAVLLVNLWLGFPYFYLISSGALQALPSELEEAAAIDGASPAQIMARIKLPLLLQILSPLLIVFLQLVGVLTPRTLIKQWRIAIVVIFFMAAIITPSGDPITLMALGLPLTVLYFVAILIGFVATRKRVRNSA